jgi:hypothetical protein
MYNCTCKRIRWSPFKFAWTMYQQNQIMSVKYYIFSHICSLVLRCMRYNIYIIATCNITHAQICEQVTSLYSKQQLHCLQTVYMSAAMERCPKKTVYYVSRDKWIWKMSTDYCTLKLFNCYKLYYVCTYVYLWATVPR